MTNPKRILGRTIFKHSAASELTIKTDAPLHDRPASKRAKATEVGSRSATNSQQEEDTTRFSLNAPQPLPKAAKRQNEAPSEGSNEAFAKHQAAFSKQSAAFVSAFQEAVDGLLAKNNHIQTASWSMLSQSLRFGSQTFTWVSAEDATPDSVSGMNRIYTDSQVIMSSSKALLATHSSITGRLEITRGNFPETQAWEDDVTRLKRALHKQAHKVKHKIVKRTSGTHRTIEIEGEAYGPEDDDLESLFPEAYSREGRRVPGAEEGSWASSARHVKKGVSRLVRHLPVEKA